MTDFWSYPEIDGLIRAGPISELLRQTIAASRMAYLALERETGLTRASIMRFVAGKQSLRLDMADRLAVYFKLELRAKRSERKGR